MSVVTSVNFVQICGEKLVAKSQKLHI